MAFDKTKPADDSLIKDGPQLIRNNWDGIVEAQSSFKPWAVNFLDRASDGSVPNDPTAIADTIIAYSKQDGSGNPQLFTQDSVEGIRQIFNGTLSVSGNEYTINTGLGFILKVGLISNLPSIGTTVTFASSFPNNCYGITGTVKDPSTGHALGLEVVDKTGFKTMIASVDLYYVAWGD